jgi:hypothetical protein
MCETLELLGSDDEVVCMGLCALHLSTNWRRAVCILLLSEHVGVRGMNCMRVVGRADDCALQQQHKPLGLLHFARLTSVANCLWVRRNGVVFAIALRC